MQCSLFKFVSASTVETAGSEFLLLVSEICLFLNVSSCSKFALLHALQLPVEVFDKLHFRIIYI
jgi:hypothetical protein